MSATARSPISPISSQSGGYWVTYPQGASHRSEKVCTDREVSNSRLLMNWTMAWTSGSDAGADPRYVSEEPDPLEPDPPHWKG